MFLALKLTLSCAAMAITLGAAAWSGFGFNRLSAVPSGLDEAILVTVSPGILRYQPPGEFTRAGHPINAPVETRRVRRPLTIMRRQVTEAEYARCVNERACPLIPRDGAPSPERPIVKASWRDATAYAEWLSRNTGRRFRLPTDAEWAFAAGSRFRADALPEMDAKDPSKRWLARYEMEANRQDASAKTVQPVGAFGENENGLVDMAGNVWEWTDTCYERVVVDDFGTRTAQNLNCGVRVVAGRHRTYMTDFVRDPRSGGCALGIPPSNLGFRLVRDDEFWTASFNELRYRFLNILAGRG